MLPPAIDDPTYDPDYCWKCRRKFVGNDLKAVEKQDDGSYRLWHISCHEDEDEEKTEATDSEATSDEEAE